MQKLTSTLRKTTSQRTINGVISICIIIWIIIRSDYVFYSSNMSVHDKYSLLKFIAVVHFIQANVNKKWLYWLIIGIYSSLIFHLVYAYFYSFIDENHFTSNKEYGVLIKTSRTLLNISFLLFILWIITKIKPQRHSEPSIKREQRNLSDLNNRRI